MICRTPLEPNTFILDACVDTPLCVRNWVIGIALMQGLLVDWQQGTELDGSVYRVAANIPVNGIQFDPEAFVTRLRAERGA
jgi:hypothetical protein